MLPMLRCLISVLPLSLTGLAGAAAARSLLRDTQPRIAVGSAFAPELTALLTAAEVERKVSANGAEFTLAKFAGDDVVLFLSGVSMVNAAMTTQLALDRFAVRAIVFSGIAGGVS